MSFVPDVSIPKGAARRVAYFAAAVALLGLPSFAAAQWYNHGDETFSVKTTVQTPNNSTLNGFDISYVDPSVGEYFLADSTDKAILAINTSTKTPTFLDQGGFSGAPATCGVPHACNGPDGVLTVHTANAVQIWAGNYPSNVKVLDYPSGTVLTTINIPKPNSTTPGSYRTDEGCWDPEDHLVVFANDADTPPFISFISTDNDHVVKQISFDGKPGDGPNATNGIEQCQWNQREHAFYLNLPEVNGSGADTADGNVVVINPHTFKIEQTFDIPVAKCAGPQGMAIGPAPQILLGCNAKGPPNNTGPQNAAIMDEENGHLINVLDNQGGNDEVWYNPGDGHYSLAEGSHATTDYLGIVDSQPISLDQQIPIAPVPAAGSGPHSVAEDPISNEIYMPIEAAVASPICPTAGVGCVAIFKSNRPEQHYVYRDHDHDHDH
ncbi:MAG TPA: hypothetical protein VIY68_02630 [Steroidobacteraceae bacterium]